MGSACLVKGEGVESTDQLGWPTYSDSSLSSVAIGDISNKQGSTGFSTEISARC